VARPTEFVDLTTTSVTIERDLLAWARSEGVNVSDVLRKALRANVADTPGKVEKTLAKFRGLPVHVVNELKEMAIRKPFRLERRLGEVNGFYSRQLTKADVSELVPVF